jgi:cold shock CspA family protein
MKEWKTKKADNGKVYVHLHKNRAAAYKTLQEPWGVRFDIELDAKAV